MKRAREIGNSHSSLTGLFSSVKNGRQINFESSLELDFAEILEYESKVETYLEQPTKIDLQEGWYYPDFLVKYTPEAKMKFDFENTFFEVKYTYEINKKKSYYDHRFSMIKDSCRELGLRFEIVTEEDIRNEYLDNIKMLNHYKYKSVDPIIYQLVLEEFDKNEFITPQQLRDVFPGGLYEKSHALFVTWHLLANNIVMANLDTKLTMNTELTKLKFYHET